MERLNLDISWRSIWRVFLAVALVAILIWAHEAVLGILLALVISVALDPIVSFLEKHSIPRILGTLLVYISILLILVFVLYSIIPVFLFELNGFLDNLGSLIAKISGEGATGLLSQINTSLEGYLEIFLKGGGSIFNLIISIFGGIASLVAIVVISFYLTVSKNGLDKFIRSVAPDYYEGRLLSIIQRARMRIGRWFGAQIILSLVMGAVTFVGLQLFGVKYSLFLALVTAIFEIVPIVGPIFSGTLAVVVASTDSLTLALYIALFYLIVQQLESHILIPLIMRRMTELHPVMILGTLLIASQLLGFLGLILAVPMAIILQEFLGDYSRRRPTRFKISDV